MITRNTRKTSIATAIVAAAALLLSACTGAGAGASDPDNPTLRAGVNQEATSFDPAQLQSSPGSSVQFWAPLYDTLLTRAPDGEIVPNMADWSYDESLTNLTLTLRDDLQFADGTPIVASDVVESLTNFRDGTAADAVYLAGLTDIRESDETTIVLTLAEPDPGLLFKLSSSAGAISSADGFDGMYPTEAGVSGAYVLNRAETQPGVQFVYDRNDTYWNDEAWPYERITLRVLIDPTARINALKSGQIDVGVIDSQSMAEVENQDGLDVTIQSASWEGLYIFDRDGAMVEALGDPRVRQAMNMAFDRDAIAEQLFLGTVEPNSQIFREGSDAYYDGHQYEYDVEAARDLMAEAGYADGFTVRMPSVGATSYLDPTIVDSLGQIGITVEFETMPLDQSVSRQLAGEYPMGVTRYTQDAAWIDFSRHIMPDSPWNPLGSETPELDALLDAAQYASDDERAAADEAIGQYLFEQAWFIPLTNASQIVGHGSGVEVTTQVGLSVLPLQNYAPAE